MKKLTSGERMGAIAAVIAMAVVISVALWRDSSSAPIAPERTPAATAADTIASPARTDSTVFRRHKTRKPTRKKPAKRQPKRRSPLDEPV